MLNFSRGLGRANHRYADPIEVPCQCWFKVRLGPERERNQEVVRIPLIVLGSVGKH
jgi:hypothetical protein